MKKNILVAVAFVAMWLAILSLVVLLVITCRKAEKPPEYEEVVKTLYPRDFDFEPGVGADFSEDNLALWRTRASVDGSAWVNWQDSGAAVIEVMMRKTDSAVAPSLGVYSGANILLKASPADTFGVFVSGKVPLGPSLLMLEFVPDEGNLEAGVNLYVKYVKVTTWKLVKP